MVWKFAQNVVERLINHRSPFSEEDVKDMKIEDINMKALSEKYLEFLRTHENIGCPMLAQALAELIDGAT